MRLMAFDPGVTTGVAWTTPQGTETAHIKGDLAHKMVWDVLENYKPEKIVCERFNYQRRDKVVLEPVSIIGAVKTWYEVRGISLGSRSLTLQTPSQAMNLWTDSKLQKIGLWEPGRPHAMDALRHLLYYITTREGDMTYVRRLQSE